MQAFVERVLQINDQHELRRRRGRCNGSCKGPRPGRNDRGIDQLQNACQ